MSPRVKIENIKQQINITCGTGLLTLYLILLIYFDQLTFKMLTVKILINGNEELFNCTQRTLFVHSKEGTPGTPVSPCPYNTFLPYYELVTDRNINKQPEQCLNNLEIQETAVH